MKKRLVFAFFLILQASLLTTSCKDTPPIKEFSPKNEVRFAINNDPVSLDPRLGGELTSQIFIRALFETITRIGKDGKISLSLARSYTVSEDGTVYTFFLQPSQWSNGTPVTADDFIYAWKSVLNHTIASMHAHAYFIIKNAKPIFLREATLDTLGLKAIDPLTLEITLEHPSPFFLELLSNPLFSPICQSVVQTSPNWTQENFVSNGPFSLAYHELKSATVLKKNPLYWDADSVKTEKISFAVVEDTSTAYNMFLTGAIDWYGSPFNSMLPEYIQELQTKGFLHEPRGSVDRWIICNTQKKYLSTKEIRHAISMGIDRSALCKDLLQNLESPLSSILPQNLSFMPPAFQKNIELAKQQFEASAIKLGYPQKKYPKLHLIMIMGQYNSIISQALQYQLKKDLNLDIQIELCEKSMYRSKLYSRAFDLAFIGWCAWINDPVDYLNYLREANNGINCTGWQSPEFTKLLQLSDQEADPEKRKELLAKAEALAMQDLPIIPLYTNKNRYAKTNLQGEIFSSSGALELKEIERIV